MKKLGSLKVVRMKRAVENSSTPPASKRTRRMPPEASEEEDSEMDVTPGTQILTQDEHFAGIKSENMVV